MGRRSSRRVFLHVGLPKTGTTFLQGVLTTSRKTLREHGVLFPWPTGSHFWAAQDLTEHLFLGQENPRVPGAWGKLARKARRWPDTTVLSHELFTLASAQQAQQAVTDLEPAELHIVLTVRDYERQLPAVWQERLKNGSKVSFARHFSQAVEKEPSRRAEPAGFWRQQDAVGILARWAEVVPRDRIHVITVPQRGAPRDTLWRRFAGVVGVDADSIDLESIESRGNVSMRPAQAQLLRRINSRLQGALPPKVYRPLVKGYLTQAAAGSSAHTAYGFNDEQQAATREWSEELRDALATGGYDVVGDVDDLVAVPAPSAHRELDDVPDDEQAQATILAAAALVRWMADPPDTEPPKPLRALVEHVRTRG